MSLEIETVIEEASIIESIKSLNENDFKIIAESALLFLLNKEEAERLNNFNESLVQIANSKEILKWLLKQFKQAINQNIEPMKISKYFQTKFGFDEAKLVCIKKLWENNWNNLKETQNSKFLMVSQLIDMEWKFGLTASTNHIDKVGNAFLQIKLVYNNGQELQSKFLELTLPQFYSFLHEMNKAKSQIEYLS